MPVRKPPAPATAGAAACGTKTAAENAPPLPAPVKNALVFGGSFDPPHIGHMAILQSAIQLVQPSAVWVLPAGIAPHKQASSTPFALRMAMCRCFLPLFPQMCISPWEAQKPGKSYTISTISHLQKENPGFSWYLCIGQDMFLSFCTWHHWQALLGMLTLVVAPRPGGTPQALAHMRETICANGGKLLFVQSPPVLASSSAIRKCIAGGGTSNLLPPPANEIVRQHGLYRRGK